MNDIERWLEANYEPYAPLSTLRATTSLYLAFTLVRERAGAGEVVIPATVCPNVALAALYAGMTPRFCDVELDTWCMSPATTEAAMSSATRAIVVVHMFGKRADTAGLLALCAERGVAAVDDIALAIGGDDLGRPLGTRADFTVMSFNGTKIVGGDSGALLTREPADAARARVLQADLPLTPSGAERARIASDFSVRTKRTAAMLRAHGLEQASDEWLADTDRFRPFFVGRGDWAVSTDETLAGLRELSAERALRYANYLAIADDLAPTTPFVRFSPDEMCWRLPVLLRDQEVRQSVVERVRARGALISDHYFPASFLFGQPGGCPNARAIGLRAANLWVDEKARDMPVDWIAEQINAAAA